MAKVISGNDFAKHIFSTRFDRIFGLYMEWFKVYICVRTLYISLFYINYFYKLQTDFVREDFVARYIYIYIFDNKETWVTGQYKHNNSNVMCIQSFIYGSQHIWKLLLNNTNNTSSGVVYYMVIRFKYCPWHTIWMFLCVCLSVCVSISTVSVFLFLSGSVSLFVTCVVYVQVIANTPFHATSG